MTDFIYNILDRKIISVSGEEVDSFLQSIITNDINKVSKTNSIYSCLLTPQGKYLFDFFISIFEDKFLIDIDSARATDFISKLNLYRLRKKIQINLEEEYKIVSLTSKTDNISFQDQISTVNYIDPRHLSMGYRAIIKNKDMDSFCEQYTQNKFPYEYIRIKNTIPEGGKDLIIDKSFPLEYGIDILNGIDFKKGCYVGQEVTARTKYRGVIRKKIYQVLSDIELETGQEIYMDDNKIGHITSSYQNIGIALIREEEYHSLIDQTPNINGSKVEIIAPIWQV